MGTEELPVAVAAGDATSLPSPSISARGESSPISDEKEPKIAAWLRQTKIWRRPGKIYPARSPGSQRRVRMASPRVHHPLPRRYTAHEATRTLQHNRPGRKSLRMRHCRLSRPQSPERRSPQQPIDPDSRRLKDLHPLHCTVNGRPDFFI